MLFLLMFLSFSFILIICIVFFSDCLLSLLSFFVCPCKFSHLRQPQVDPSIFSLILSRVGKSKKKPEKRDISLVGRNTVARGGFAAARLRCVFEQMAI